MGAPEWKESFETLALLYAQKCRLSDDDGADVALHILVEEVDRLIKKAERERTEAVLARIERAAQPGFGIPYPGDLLRDLRRKFLPDEED